MVESCQYFVARLCARNCIPIKKLLAMSETDQLDFFATFSYILERMAVVKRCSAVLGELPIFLVLDCVLEIVFHK